MIRTALLQLTSGDDPAANLTAVSDLFDDAVAQGAQFILTPEVTNCVSSSRRHQADVLRLEEEDETLPALRRKAADAGVWLLIGSLAVKTQDADGRFANRSVLISPEGEIAARYDKIHMFDVQVTPEETYRESDGYRPGETAVVAQTPFAEIGMAVCYDLRFPLLHQALVRAGAQILTFPAAFSPVTGAAHWEPLLRARAIETGCFVLAPAQTGHHATTAGKPRLTYGHSMAVDPWGNVILNAGTEPGAYLFDMDLSAVEDARRRVPSVANARQFHGPA